MKSPLKFSFFVSLLITSVLLFACSGPAGTTTGGGGGGPYTISVTVSGLTGSRLVTGDNATDKRTITATGTFPCATTIAKNVTYAVTVQTQPSNPTQSCAVNPTTGSGTATANVTVTVTCTTNPVSATIGGMVSGLVANSSVILQNNGGDSLTVTANGSFTFKTPVTGTDVYKVTVLTQPDNPNQICTVMNGQGVARANVTNVAANCALT